MKTLLLASNSDAVFRERSPIGGRRIVEHRVAWITTAGKGARDRGFLDRLRVAMREEGIDFKEVDLEDMTPSDFRSTLHGCDALWMEGGNTYYLLRAIQAAGLSTTIRELVTSGFPYIGTSAGAYVACPTIEMADWGPGTKPRFGLIDLRALALVPFLVKVHATPELVVQWKPAIARAAFPVRILADGQALLIEDDIVTFRGTGAELTPSSFAE